MSIRSAIASLWADIATPPAAETVEGKAGPVGPGAGKLMTEYLLPTMLATNEQQRIARALKLGMEVDWVRSAERIISSRIAGCEWHLEDPDGETIDDEYDNPLAVQAFTLIAEPQQALPLLGPDGVGRRQSRRQMWSLWSRHLGLSGSAVLYLDTLDQNMVPHAILYIKPDRLTPEYSERGSLQGWTLDKGPGRPGTPLPIDQVILGQFEPPDEGVFGPGLIQSAMAKAINSGLIDKHIGAVLMGGGRISGVMAPKEGAITDENVYKQLVNDWRNVVEQPEAARRLQIVRAPVEFTSTTQSIADLQIATMMNQNRDALLALWGVPLPVLNGQNAGSTGLNGGDARKYDEAALWQGAVQGRLDELYECIQHGILDRFEPVLGWTPKLIWDLPTFDDDAPMYEMAGKAMALPLRNSERRAIVGLDPFGDPALDNAVWMPINITQLSMAPDEDGNIPDMEEVPGMEPKPVPPMLQPFTGQEPPKEAGAGGLPGAEAAKPVPPALQAAALAKAAAIDALPPGVRILPTGTRRLRDELDKRLTPKVTDALAATLDRQGQAIGNAVEANWDAIVRHDGKDESQWWREADIERVLRPVIGSVAEQVEAHINEAFGAN